MPTVISKIDGKSNLPPKELNRVAIPNGNKVDGATVGSITITSDGSPIKVGFERSITGSDNGANSGSMVFNFSAAIVTVGYFSVNRNGLFFQQTGTGGVFVVNAGSNYPANSFYIIDDSPPVGSVTYTFTYQTAADGGTDYVYMQDINLVARRL